MGSGQGLPTWALHIPSKLPYYTSKKQNGGYFCVRLYYEISTLCSCYASLQLFVYITSILRKSAIRILNNCKYFNNCNLFAFYVITPPPLFRILKKSHFFCIFHQNWFHIKFLFFNFSTAPTVWRFCVRLHRCYQIRREIFEGLFEERKVVYGNRKIRRSCSRLWTR